MKIRLNAALGGHPEGTTLVISTFTNGVPIDLYWRRRIKDAKTDNCLTVLTDKTKTKSKGT